MSSEELSSYVDHEALLEALRSLTGRTDVEIEDDPEVSRTTKGVEGFLSLMLRVRVSCRVGDDATLVTSLIFKRMPRMGSQYDMVKATRVFPREGTFYQEVCPLLRKASGGKVPLPVPTAYYSRYGGDDDVILMEDLGAVGFRTPTTSFRTNGLDIDHCRLAMVAYGKFHALTMAAERFLPGGKVTWVEAFPELSKDAILFSTETDGSPAPIYKMLQQGVDILTKVAKGLSGLPQEAEASGKLKSALENAFDVMRKLIKPRDDEPNVLTHGDCWINNIMFRYEKTGDELKPVDVRLVDFQTVRYCHPCIDLVNFFYLNIRKSCRLKHMDNLVRIYYETLTEGLKVMGYGPPPFSIHKLLADINGEYKCFGLLTEVFFMPLSFFDEEYTPLNAEDFTPDKYDEDFATGNSSSVLRRYYSDTRYRNALGEAIRDVVENSFPNGIHSPASALFVP